MGKESEFEYFTKEDRQMATKLMKKKKMPNLICIREVQITSMLRATAHTH